MPSRRSLLTGCALASTVAVAGCLDQLQTTGTHEIVADELTIEDNDDGPAVAAEYRELEDEDGRGNVTATSVAYERGERIELLSELRVGTSDDDWSHSEFEVVHDWTDADETPAIRAFDSNLSPVDSDGELSLEPHTDESIYEWTGELVEPADSTQIYRFLSEVEAPDTGPDTRLGTVRFRAGFDEGGLFGGERGVGFSHRLSYGDVDPKVQQTDS